MNIPLLALVVIVVVGLAVLPLSYYLRSRRNPQQSRPPPGVNHDTFKEWKD
jgi:uncharacterized membrane-anchored protein